MYYKLYLVVVALAIGGDSKRGAGLGGRARALLDPANKRTNDTRPSCRKFHCSMHVQMRV